MESTAKHKVYNVIILDETGSMESIKQFIVTGFNELIQSLKGIESEYPEQEHIITFMTFNSNGMVFHQFNQPLSTTKEISHNDYNPDAMTPLYDAIGLTCTKMQKTISADSPHNVLVSILTDGYENHSREYKRKDIADMIRHLKEKNWTFTFIGTSDIDYEKIASDMEIEKTNISYFAKTTEGISMMIERERHGRSEFNRKIRNKENLKDNFYKDSGNPK